MNKERSTSKQLDMVIVTEISLKTLQKYPSSSGVASASVRSGRSVGVAWMNNTWLFDSMLDIKTKA